MAAAANPVNSLLRNQLLERLAKMGGGEASKPDAAGEQLSQQFSQLSGADPQMMSKALTQVKTMMVALYARTAFQIPEASRHIAQAQKSIDAALKAMETATATVNTVRPPIANNAALPNPIAGPNQPPEGAEQ